MGDDDDEWMIMTIVVRKLHSQNLLGVACILRITTSILRVTSVVSSALRIAGVLWIPSIRRIASIVSGVVWWWLIDDRLVSNVIIDGLIGNEVLTVTVIAKSSDDQTNDTN